LRRSTAGRIVGGTASEARQITIPGATALTAAKITLTGLLPGHRRTGIASAFMRRQLADLRSRGEPLAILTTSQSSVPGRHGFATATSAMAVELTPGPPEPGPLPGAAPRIRLIDRAEAEQVLPGVYDAHRRRQAGQVSRPPGFWREWFLDRPQLRTAPGERFVVLAEQDDGMPHGYLTYRLEHGSLREEPVRELVVEDLITTTDAARRALWGFCAAFDQAAKVSAWNLPADEPLAWIVPHGRTLRVTGLRPFLRLRLVDVAAALAARRYAAPGAIVLEVTDQVIAGSAGRYGLRGGPDGAECTATTAGADLDLSVAELAAVYLGGTAFTTLARAGRVAELVPGALSRADAMFGWHPAPWTVTDW
jgi:predicted acetyltransferase